MSLILTKFKHFIDIYVSTIIVFNLSKFTKGLMETLGTNRLEDVIKRLDEAERRAKLLNTEVKRIKQEISILRSSISNLPAENTYIIPSTSSSTTRQLSNGITVVDGPSNEKRFKPSISIEDGYATVYTDGACENNGKPKAKAGIGVWFGDNHPLNVSKPVEGKATNNTAEIQACVEGLKVLEEQGINKAKIYTDSQFTINCMTIWIQKWKRNSWKTASGGDVKNKEDLQKLDAMMGRFLDVKWVHIAGHKGIRGNDGADKLAKEGALRYKPK